MLTPCPYEMLNAFPNRTLGAKPAPKQILTAKENGNMSDVIEPGAIAAGKLAGDNFAGAAASAYSPDQLNKFKVSSDDGSKNGDPKQIEVTDPYNAEVKMPPGQKGFKGSEGGGVVMKGDTPTINLPAQPDQAKPAIPESNNPQVMKEELLHLGKEMPNLPKGEGDHKVEGLPGIKKGELIDKKD
jgi:hypothetical protein